MNDELLKIDYHRLSDFQEPLTISREVLVKIGKHAWNVFPLEAFGYLLGRDTDNTIYAALPCSKTANWYKFEDRWHGIERDIDQAIATAKLFDLSVIGCYASCDIFGIANTSFYPLPPVIEKANLSFWIYYQSICCSSCSTASLFFKDTRLIRGEDYLISPGKRCSKYINQKRILQGWCQLHGLIDYSNKPLSTDLSTVDCYVEVKNR
jgi:hypothetical protein